MPVPTVEDARRVALIAAEEGATQVLLFGSVARGTQGPDSDIDIVAIFDDLGDYSVVRARRETIEQRSKQTRAGIPLDVKITDRPYWRRRVNQVRTSLERHVDGYAIELVNSGPISEVNWDKEIDMPVSDPAEAIARLDEADSRVQAIRGRLQPDPDERAAWSEDHDLDDYRFRRHRRFIGLCSEAHMLIELTLKSLIHLHGDKHPDKTHEIGGLLKCIGSDRADALRRILGSHGLTPSDISHWRVTGTYTAQAPLDKTASATYDFTNRMILAAHDAITHATTEVEGVVGYAPDINRIKRILPRLRYQLESQGLDGDLPGDDA